MATLTKTKALQNKRSEHRSKSSRREKERVLSLLRAAQFNAGEKTDSVKMIREERA